MSWTVFLLRAQKATSRKHGSEYEWRRAGLGDEFLDQIAHAMNRLAENPELQSNVS